MPISPSLISGAILAAGPELNGPDFLRLSTTLGTAISLWAVTPSNVVLSGVTTGSAGSGTVFGTVSVAPNPSLLIGTFSGAGLVGPLHLSLARAIATGVSVSFTANATYQGSSVGVGAGTDISTIVTANPTTLTAQILSVASSSGLVGPNIGQIATAVGNGVSAMLLGNIGNGAVTGLTGPLASTGTSISRIV